MIYRSEDDFDFEYQTKLTKSAMIELYSNEDYGKIGVRRARKKAKTQFEHLKNAVIKDESDETSSEEEEDAGDIETPCIPNIAQEPPTKIQRKEEDCNLDK